MYSKTLLFSLKSDEFLLNNDDLGGHRVFESSADASGPLSGLGEGQAAARCGFVLKMMDFILKMMDFVLKMMDFILKMMDFILKMMDFILKMMDFVLQMMDFSGEGAAGHTLERGPFCGMITAKYLQSHKKIWN